MKLLITGVAGFIGFSTAQKMLSLGNIVIGVDNINSYYDQNLKKARLKILSKSESFIFINGEISEKALWYDILKNHSDIEITIHLAAQAGVRYSIENPREYCKSNLTGFLEVLEYIRHSGQKHLVYASSSSVYGANTKLPYDVEDRTDQPLSLYAATKKSNELMAYSYSNLFNFATTGLRFFTVYGPWGRPDMAYWLFTSAILENRPIKIFNSGEMYRDFTYVDDIVEGIEKVMGRKSIFEKPFKVYNLGNSRSEKLSDMIDYLETILEKKAERIYLPMQSGDVYKTHAELTAMIEEFNWKPSTTLETGLKKFVEWYRNFYKV